MATFDRDESNISLKEKRLLLMNAILKDQKKTNDPILASFQAWIQIFDEGLELIKRLDIVSTLKEHLKLTRIP